MSGEQGQSIFHSFLQELSKLPDDAPDWAHAQWFLQQLSTLYEEISRSGERRRAAKEKLRALQETWGDSLAYFECPELPDTWVDACSTEDLVGLLEQLEQLQSLLADHAKLLARRPATVSEAARQRAELYRLEHTVKEALNRLGLSRSGAAESAPAGGPAAAPPEAAGPGAEHDPLAADHAPSADSRQGTELTGEVADAVATATPPTAETVSGASAEASAAVAAADLPGAAPERDREEGAHPDAPPAVAEAVRDEVPDRTAEVPGGAAEVASPSGDAPAPSVAEPESDRTSSRQKRGGRSESRETAGHAASSASEPSGAGTAAAVQPPAEESATADAAATAGAVDSSATAEAIAETAPTGTVADAEACWDALLSAEKGADARRLAERIRDALTENVAVPPVELPVLVWYLIRDGRTALAYQLARVSALQWPSLPGIPDAGCLRVAALGPWAAHPGDEVACQIAMDLARFDLAELEHPRRPYGEALRLLWVAGALRPALIDSSTGAPSVLGQIWLPEGLHELQEYARLIMEFGEQVRCFDPTALKLAQSQQAWQNRMDAVKARAEEAWTRALSTTINFARATQVWQHWLLPGQPVHRLLTPIRDGKFEEKDAVRELVRQLSDGHFVDELIWRTHQARRRNAGGHPRPIVGRANTQLKNRLEQVLEIAREWLHLLDTAPGTGQGFVQEQTKQLQQQLARRHEVVLEELERYQGQTRSLCNFAAAACCRRSIENVQALFDPDVPVDLQPTPVRQLLNADLLAMSGFSLNDHWEPSGLQEALESGSREFEDAAAADMLKRMTSELLRVAGSDAPDWEAVFAEQVDNRDHARTLYVLEYLKKQQHDSQKLSILQHTREESLQQCRDTLRERLEELQSAVENAFAGGLLTEGERADLAAELDGLAARLPEILDFGPCHERLLEIKERIESLRTEKTGQTRRRIQEAGIADRPDVLDRVDRALERGDILTANEYIDAALAGEALPEESDELEVFLQFVEDSLPQIIGYVPHTPRSALINQIRNGRSIPGVDMQRVPGAQAQSAAAMLETWFQCKRGAEYVAEDVLEKILTCFGFDVHSVQRARGEQWRVCVEPLKDRDVCPVFTYGSAAQGRYRIVCMWERPSEDLVLQRAPQHLGGAEPVIVFHFGCMTEKRRRDLSRLCREHRRTLLVVDDALVVYLCGQRGNRLPALFRCSLPFTYCEPYADSPGLVHPEMFYGRRDELRSILAPEGSCFIYGGRQLGKTALLRHAERTFHDPRVGRFAFYVDLKAEGIAAERPLDDLWPVLIGRLQDAEILPAGYRTYVGRDKLLQDVQKWLEEDPRRRILLLLDEADQFLDADGREEFTRSARLKSLMDATQRRFKVVFAGLHNVQRTTRQSNHPLAHFQDPICVGPLLANGEWREARLLIERPFAALGYRFEHPDLVTRILSRTNYYPNLMQLYCRQLLQHLVSRPGSDNNGPPFVITARDVDDAFHDQRLQENIRHKLDLTLQLDQRYEVIAYAMALEYLLRDPHIHVQGRPVHWIRENAMEWWPEGFAHCNSEEAIRTLADEMVGLGVFRKAGPDRYALRSPNVVSLLGTVSQVEEKLLREREKPAEYEPSRFRSAFCDASGPRPDRRSPLTAAQEAKLRARSNDVVILVGCPAAGLADVEDFVQLAVGHEMVRKLPASATLQEFQAELDRLYKRERHGVTVVLVPAEADWSAAWVEKALKRIGDLRATDRFARVVFVADPEKLVPLIDAQKGRIRSFETKADEPEVLHLRRWHDSAVRQWLDDCGFPSDRQTRQQVTEATDNWPILLARLYGLARNDPAHLNDHTFKLLQLLEQPEEKARLREAFGLNQAPQADVLKALAELGSASEEDLRDIVGDSGNDHVTATLAWAECLDLGTCTGTWTLSPIVKEVLLEPAAVD